MRATPPMAVGSRVRLEGGPHRSMGVVEPGADRARRDAETAGDLRRLKAGVVPEHEQRSLFGWYPLEAAVELLPVADEEDVVGAPVRLAGGSRLAPGGALAPPR